MDPAVLLARHPMKVKSSLHGRYHILTWYSHAEQWRVIAGKSENAVAQTLRAAAREQEDARVGEFMEVDFVRPPSWVLEAVAQEAHRDEVESFYSYVCGHLTGFFSPTRRVPPLDPPPGLEVCPGFEKDPAAEDGYGYHKGCRHCLWGYRPIEGTYEEFFESVREKYRSAKRLYVDPLLRDLPQEEADPHRPVGWIQEQAPRGLSLRLEPGALHGFLKNLRPAPRGFIQKVRDLPTDQMVEVVRQTHEDAKAEKKRQIEARNRQKELDVQVADEKFRSIF